MLVALQPVGVAVTPLNFTVLVPWVLPKFVPVITTDVPVTPDVGLNPVIVGPLTAELKSVCTSLALKALL
jgi:hypothetical protein